MLDGWKQFGITALALLWAILDLIGVNVPLADQEAIATAVFIIAALVARIMAKGPIALLSIIRRFRK